MVSPPAHDEPRPLHQTWDFYFVMLCGSETCLVKVGDLKRLELTEIRMTIWMSDTTLSDKVDGATLVFLFFLSEMLMK